MLSYIVRCVKFYNDNIAKLRQQGTLRFTLSVEDLNLDLILNRQRRHRRCAMCMSCSFLDLGPGVVLNLIIDKGMGSL